MKRFLLIIFAVLAAFQAKTQIIISQYYEGSSNDKWIEITNVGGSSVDLSSPQLYLALFSNANADAPASSTTNGTLTLSGTIASGESFIYRNSSALNPTSGNLTGTPINATSVCSFNGDDLVILTTSNSSTAGVAWGARIDVVGDGTSWGTDKSFYRNFSVVTPNTTFSLAGEWTEASISTVNSAGVGTTERLGFHNFTGAGSCSATPTDGATNFASPSQGSTAINLSWDPGTTGDSYVVVALQGATPTAATAATLDGDDFTATFNADFSLAPDLDGVAAQGKVVYAGSATTATVTGLTAATSYTFRIYHYCAAGGDLYNYTATQTLTQSTAAAPPVSAGDILFVAYASDNPDELAFFTFVDIPGGTVLSITDNGWNGSALNTTEGILEWTAPSTGLAAGNTVRIFDLSAINPTTDKGTVVESAGDFAPATAGDQFLMFVGDALSPTFITGISSFTWEFVCPGTVTAQQSCVPPGLSAATTGEAHEGFLSELDNGYFDPSLVPGFPTPPATIAEAKTYINDRDYWTRSDSDIDPADWDINPWDDFFDDAIPCPTVQATDLVFTAVEGTSSTISWTAGVGGDSYLVVVNEGSAVTFEPTDGDDPAIDFGTVSSDFSLATDQGGGRVVAYTTGTSVNLTGLSIATTYYVRVFHVASTGPYCYITTSSTTNDGTQNFTTLAYDPVTIVEWTFPDGSADAQADDGIAPNLSEIITPGTGISALAFTDVGSGGGLDRAASASGWTQSGSVPDPDDYFEVSFTTEGYWSNALSYKIRGDANAPAEFRVDAQIDGSGFASLTSSEVTVADDWTTGVLDLFVLQGFSDKATVTLRFTSNSANKVGGGLLDGTGTVLIDDIEVGSRPIYYRSIASGAISSATTWEISDNPTAGFVPATQGIVDQSEVYANIRTPHAVTSGTFAFGSTTDPTVGGMTIEDGGTLTISGTFTVNSILSVAQTGTITESGASTLTFGGDGTFETERIAVGDGIAVTTEDFSACDQFVFSGAIAQNTTGMPTDIDSLVIDNSGPGVALSDNLTVNTSLVLAQGVLDASGFSLTLNGNVTRTTGTLTTDGTTNVTISGLASATLPAVFPFTGASTVNNLTVDRVDALLGLDQDLTVDGTTTLANGADIDVSTTALSLDGDVSAGVGSLILTGTSSSLTISGAGALPSPFPFGSSDIGSLAISRSSANLELTGDLTVATDLTLATGATLTTGANILILEGAVASTGTLAANDGALSVSGTAGLATLPVITGNLLIFELNRAAGASLNSSLAIDAAGDFTLTDGILNAAGNTVTVNNPSTLAVTGSSASYLENGTLVRETNSAAGYTYPLGAGGKYRPVVVAPIDANANSFGAQFVNASPSGSGAPVGPEFLDPPVASVSDFEHYVINRTGASSASVTLPYDAGTYDAGGSVPNALVCRWDGALWVSEGNTATTGDAFTGTVTSNPVASFSPFAVGSVDDNSITILPVELLSFSGERTGEDVMLLWNTASELNNDRFEVQRARDVSFREFETVGTVSGRGTTQEITEYIFVDREVATDAVWYYRLRQVDYDGTATLSGSIEIGAQTLTGDLQWRLTPNPSSGSGVELIALGDRVAADEPVGVQVLTVSGVHLLGLQGTYTQVREQLLVALSNLAPGVYLVQFQAKGLQQTLRHIRY